MQLNTQYMQSQESKDSNVVFIRLELELPRLRSINNSIEYKLKEFELAFENGESSFSFDLRKCQSGVGEVA